MAGKKTGADGVDGVSEKEKSLDKTLEKKTRVAAGKKTSSGTSGKSGRIEVDDDLKSIKAAKSFFDINYNKVDKDLSPEQSREWTAIYASFRSRTPLTGTVIGVDAHTLSITDPVTGKKAKREILCLVIMDYRVKVIIPQTDVWHDPEKELPNFVIKRMVGAKIDYVITDVDRLGECAIASRRLALNIKRNQFFKDSRKNEPGNLLDCYVLVVGPSRLIAECNGFDLHIRNRDLSYTAVVDLRKEYRPGQEIKAKLIRALRDAGKIEVAVKEVNPNPFDGAESRHPIGSSRIAVISGTYAGGVFCTLPDDTTCMCLYSPAYFEEEFFHGDSVVILISQYDYERKMIYGKIRQKI